MSSYQLILAPKAEEEYIEAAAWYETQAEGRGTKFIEYVEKVIARIQRTPNLYAEKKSKRREAALIKYPYVILYRVKPRLKQILVVGVFHTSRNPKKKASR